MRGKKKKEKHENITKKPTIIGGESLSWDWEGAADFGSSQGRGTSAEADADRPWVCCTPGRAGTGQSEDSQQLHPNSVLGHGLTGVSAGCHPPCSAQPSCVP